jgi:hypothetical protein
VNVKDLSKEFSDLAKVTLYNSGTATEDLKITGPSSTSQIEIKDNSINSSVQDNLSASANIEVYNPEKIEDGKTVEVTSATAPTA